MPLMRTPEGVAVNVPIEQVQGARDVGYVDVTPEQAAPDLTRPDTSAAQGIGGAITAGASSALSGATLGLSDVAIRGLASKGELEDIRAAREAHPVVSAGANVAGAILPAVLTGGESLPASLASRAGAGVAEAAGGGLRGALLGGAAEGALIGAGQGVSELALSSDPLTLERAASTIGSNALFGTAVGAGAGAVGHELAIGLQRAKGAIDTALERRALAKTRMPVEAIESGDLSLVDNKILSAAERDELARISKEQAPQRKAFTDDLDTWRRSNRDAHELRGVAGASLDPNLREAGGAFDRANLRLRAALDDRVGFAEDPGKSLKLVRAQGQALDEMQRAAQAQATAWREAVDTAPQRFRADIEAIASKPTQAERAAEAKARGIGDGYYGPFTGPAGVDFAVERAIKEYSQYTWGSFGNGLKQPRIVDVMPTLERMSAANQKLQSQLEELAKPAASPLLTKIEEARAALNAPKQPSAGREILNAAAPFAGPLGAAAATGTRLIGSFRKIASAAGERAGKAASSFLGAAAKAAPYAPPVATRVLAAVRFADKEDQPKPMRPAVAAPSRLHELFLARTGELKSQVQVTPDGQFQMRPDARAKLASRFDGIRGADPHAADQLEEIGARRIEYLASIIPRRPDVGGVPLGTDRWQASDMEMRSFARSVAAVEDPHAVFERAASGHVVPEEAAALRAVWGELLNDYTATISAKLPTLRATLPYRRRLALSILTGAPVDAAMTPGVLRVIQGMYAGEPGTGGGTQAPRPQPQFGSVRADKGTPAQQREQGVSS